MLRIGGRYRWKSTGYIVTILNKMGEAVYEAHPEESTWSMIIHENQLEEVKDMPREIKIGEKYHLINLEEARKDDRPIIKPEMQKYFGGRGEVEIIDFGDYNIRVIFPDNQTWWVNKEWLIPIKPKAKKEKSKIRLIRK